MMSFSGKILQALEKAGQSHSGYRSRWHAVNESYRVVRLISQEGRACFKQISVFDLEVHQLKLS